MSQSRKYRGFKTERVVSEYLSQWWPGAAVQRGNGTDIVNIPMIDFEVKARSKLDFPAWLRQVSKRAEKHGDLPIIVSRLNGQGESDVGGYLACLTLADLVQLLIKAGYADLAPNVRELEMKYCTCGNTLLKGQKCVICEKLNNANL